MEIKFKKLDPCAFPPVRAHIDDAGFDLYATRTEWDEHDNLVCHTGLAFEIPVGYVGLLFPRSSCASKSLIMSDCVGVIDAGYRGEVTAKFKALSQRSIYRSGERCCQVVFIKLPEVIMAESKNLSDTERGTGGYGSTGK